MRGLTAMERELLVDGLSDAAPTNAVYPGSAISTTYGVLVGRGCMRIVGLDDDWETWCTTPRGRLALLCDVAVRAVLA